MVIRTQKIERDFTVVRNEIIRHAGLSWKAKGILIYLLHLPPDWELHPRQMVRFASDGKHSLYSGLRELVSAGYLIRQRWRDVEGKFTRFAYVVHDVPLVLSSVPQTGFWDVDGDEQYQALMDLDLGEEPVQ